MTRIAQAAVLMMLLAGLASADSVMFGLGGDPGQYYTFTPVGAPAGVTDTEPAGPYPGVLVENNSADNNFFFCITFTKVAYWGASYEGTLIAPTTQPQLEAAYLASELYNLGDQNAPLSVKGAISMAIWQITDPTPGHVPVDPAAQPYVAQAQAAYNAGKLTPAQFTSSKIFVPNDPSIQDFMLSAAQLTATPEPGTIALMLTGLGLIAISRLRRSR